MNNFSETHTRYKNFQREFSKNVRDNFGYSINNEGLEPIAKHLEMLCIQENKIDLETLNIQRILVEAKSIIFDIGG